PWAKWIAWDISSHETEAATFHEEPSKRMYTKESLTKLKKLNELASRSDESLLGFRQGGSRRWYSSRKIQGVDRSRGCTHHAMPLLHRKPQRQCGAGGRK